MRVRVGEHDAAQSWAVGGTYFEACNCDAVCPCRRKNDQPGGLSTYGECLFVLSWAVAQGNWGALDLGGAAVAMAGRYVDADAVAHGGPLGTWSVVLYLDDRLSEPQAEALGEIFLGRTGAREPRFAAAIGTVLALRRARIELDHASRRPSVRIDARVTASAGERVDTRSRISCGIPGHGHPGDEWIAQSLAVHDAGLDFQFSGRCGFSSRFAYASG